VVGQGVEILKIFISIYWQTHPYKFTGQTIGARNTKFVWRCRTM